MVASQMRIAMLSVHSCPVGNLGSKDTGGMSVYIREVARQLGEQGHMVDIYTRVHDPRDNQIYDLGQNARLIHLMAGEREKIDKIAVYSHLPEFACNLENFRKRNSLHYDLVFSHYWLSALVGSYLQEWWHVPNIVMFHTVGVLKNAIGIGEGEPELRIKTEKEITRNCHHIITPTEKEKGELILHCHAVPERISVIPCGVNLNLFQPRDKQKAKRQLGFAGEKILLFVGRIDPLKGLEQLLKAMPYLQNSKRPRLAIIGGGEDSRYEINRLQKLSRDLCVEASINFVGLVKQEELPCFYSAADACVIPSYYESFGLVALESLACGTPVVATDVGGLRHVIRDGETGYVAADNNPRRLADKIGLLLSRSGPDTKSALGIRASVARFSWVNIAQVVAERCRLALADYSALDS